MGIPNDPERWMRQALREAEAAADEREVPVGCVIVSEDRIIGRGHNRIEALQDPTAHAEILALTAAAATAGSWRLPDAHAFVSLEPCLMCVGALLLARIETVWFGPREPKFGACGSLTDAPALPGLNHRMRVEGGVLESESAALLRAFFRERRREGRAGTGPGPAD
ncbi:MAG: tRNA-specific adenosine deaminase [Candidatus Eisenbacteria bacterium]|nr:tRNA-specific adenosine deaminase [Candidatus Latescibacterota bacterium]MBD3301286.1 tRNA-specific adenosine deaminase [Candidatus Eisenbacteria bacterium]